MNRSLLQLPVQIQIKEQGKQEYTEPDAEKLCIAGQVSENTYPTEITLSFTAEREFSGVIRIGYKGSDKGSDKDSNKCSDKNSNKGSDKDSGNIRFFLPGFMYGTNRGDTPLLVDSKTPCMRMVEEFPASPWWMVRSDRLSHPLALMYACGRIRGFSASPYYVRSEGNRIQWYPGVKGEFDRYTGFGCSLLTGEVWYTLGYENAPWMFVDSHKYHRAAPLSDENCFHIGKGEKITVTLYCFDHEAEDERGIQDAIMWTYRKFHENPRKCRSIQETVSDMAGAIFRDAWLPEHHCYSGFVFDKGDHYEYRPLPSISWTNGLSAAVPML